MKKGSQHTPATREKMREAQKQRWQQKKQPPNPVESPAATRAA